MRSVLLRNNSVCVGSAGRRFFSRPALVGNVPVQHDGSWPVAVGERLHVCCWRVFSFVARENARVEYFGEVSENEFIIFAPFFRVFFVRSRF